MNRLGWALALNFGFAVIELIGGYLTNSVAIMSDAVHDFGDSISLALALVCEKYARRGSNREYSYGLQRLSLLSALITGTVLVTGSCFVLAHAIPRILHPTTPNLNGMLGLSVLGVVVNGYAAFRMGAGKTMNEKVLTWHLLEDLLGWISIAVVSVVMRFVDLPILDPIMAILVTLFILWGVTRNLRQTIRLFMQGSPTGINVPDITKKILEISSVEQVHDVHLWSLDGSSHVLTIHAVVSPETSVEKADHIRRNIRDLVKGVGNIHCTIEIESNTTECEQRNCVPTLASTV